MIFLCQVSYNHDSFLLFMVDENEYFIYKYRCRVSFAHLQERNIGQMLALIAKVVLFHRQRLVALNLVSESNRFWRIRKRGQNINTKNTLLSCDLFPSSLGSICPEKARVLFPFLFWSFKLQKLSRISFDYRLEFRIICLTHIESFLESRFGRRDADCAFLGPELRHVVCSA